METSTENNQVQEVQYEVFARKYRPQNFSDLLGQKALVQTLTNAINSNRIHHAYVLTGVRGVGKTSTARIIARALNCIGEDGKSGPTITPCGKCENCKAIAEDRHVDVMELDAASRTSVNDIREILDGVKYKPVNARYKVYIIDEVHMLSKHAFNALLKTLEEPPAHVKFIFATTEIRKVPVTVLSRCQRFDLQRIGEDELSTHFEKIIANENATIEEEALKIIVKSADGSARDGLSILDQALSLSDGNITAENVRAMVGLANRVDVLNAFEALAKGDIVKVLEIVNKQYEKAVEPMVILKDLIEISHMVTKIKIAPELSNSIELFAGEKERASELASKISMAHLTRIWQILLKSVSEVQIAPSQIDAVEMALIKTAYSASLPTPQEVLNDVKKNSNLSVSAPRVNNSVSNSPIQSNPQISKVVENNYIEINSFEELVKQWENKKSEPLLAYKFKNDIYPIEIKNGYMKISFKNNVDAREILTKMQASLLSLTGKKWKIDIEKDAKTSTLQEQENAVKEKDKKSASKSELVKFILSEFKGANMEKYIRKIEEAPEEQIMEEEI